MQSFLLGELGGLNGSKPTPESLPAFTSIFLFGKKPVLFSCA
jgi:hypothetical protein